MSAEPDRSFEPARPDYTLGLRFLNGYNDSLENHRVHASLNWANSHEEMWVFSVGLDMRTPSKNDQGGWDSVESTSFDIPLKQAKALHAWLGFVLAQIDAGVLPGGQ